MKFNNPKAQEVLAQLADGEGIDNPQYIEHEHSGFEAIQFVLGGTMFSIDNEDDVIIKPMGAVNCTPYSTLTNGIALLSACSLQLWSM